MEKLTMDGICRGDGKRIRICIIGAGNVATHLAVSLAEVCDLLQIASRSGESARRLCALIGGGCEPIDNLADLRADADLYLIAVSDDSIAEVVARTCDFPGVWAHTSGSVPVAVFEGKKSRFGVFYPLQTFTRTVDVEMREVPFFVEGCNREVSEYLMQIASLIADRVETADSHRRKKLHLAAVFACNFANQMWVEADSILKENGLSIEYLMPLLKVTLGKLETVSPMDAMTGPARRGDIAVINAHLDQLDGERREIYRLLSDRILHEFKSKQ